MSSKTAITVGGPREEVQGRWSGDLRPALADDDNAAVSFKDAPGDKGTEIHVELAKRGLGGGALAKAKDELRRFKQLLETGEIARSEGAPQGELVERKLKQRPAQPLTDAELEAVGVR